MVERERLGLEEDADGMFKRLSGKHMAVASDDYDLDDMFVDRAGKGVAKGMSEQRERAKAVAGAEPSHL